MHVFNTDLQGGYSRGHALTVNLQVQLTKQDTNADLFHIGTVGFQLAGPLYVPFLLNVLFFPILSYLSSHLSQPLY